MVGAANIEQSIDMDAVRAEFPRKPGAAVYLNTGSCGRKPQRVLKVLNDGWHELNLNPTIYTFYATEPCEGARLAASELLKIDQSRLLLTQNTTQGLQLAMQSFLANAGDELITTTQEHGSVNTIAQYLSESRGITVHKYPVEPLDGSDALTDGILKLVTERTRLVIVSQVNCLSGWRPNLTRLNQQLAAAKIPFLVDGAHAPGQGPCFPGDFPIWVASGHKWLGGPNGTGFFYIQPQWLPHLKPSWISDDYYREHENQLRRFEFQGTADVVRWLGLAEACRFNAALGPEKIAARELHLVKYLRERLAELPGSRVRTPLIEGETSALLTVTWDSKHVTVESLKDHLWNTQSIWTQPDFFYGAPGHGMRLSCHVSVEESDIDMLIEALSLVLR